MSNIYIFYPNGIDHLCHFSEEMAVFQYHRLLCFFVVAAAELAALGPPQITVRDVLILH